MGIDQGAQRFGTMNFLVMISLEINIGGIAWDVCFHPDFFQMEAEKSEKEIPNLEAIVVSFRVFFFGGGGGV